MTPEAFKATREALCLSQNDLAEVWGMGDNGGRTIRRWENGERPLNPVAAYCIALMLDNGGIVGKNNIVGEKYGEDNDLKPIY